MLNRLEHDDAFDSISRMGDVVTRARRVTLCHVRGTVDGARRTDDVTSAGGVRMNEVTILLLLLALACAGYTAGRLHAQFSYRIGYRFGYRQGYFDGDRASWNRRRRELQAAVASVLKT